MSRIIQWINDQAPLGGGGDGPEDEAFFELLEGNCVRVLRIAEGKDGGDPLREPARTLYAGVGSACLAAFEHQEKLWPRAEAAFDKIREHIPRLDCEQQSVHGLLKQLIETHRAEPNARLVKHSTGKRGVLKCPRFLKITPNHGPAEGGYPAYLEGVNLPKVVVVNFVSQDYSWKRRLTVESKDGHSVVINVPPAKPGDSVFVWPDGWPFDHAWNPTFTYDRRVKSTQPSTTTQRSTTWPTSPETSTSMG